MHEAALAYLRTCDPPLYAHARRHAKPKAPPMRPEEPFAALCRAIVGQQLSGTAARAIWKRVAACFSKGAPTPRAMRAIPEDTLRRAGLSRAKTIALKSLADFAHEEREFFLRINEHPDAHIHEKLRTVRGIGPWTVEMFLMFTLKREDIFSPGDLGLRKGIQKLRCLRTLPTPKEAARIAERWAPHRSFASHVLWAIVDET